MKFGIFYEHQLPRPWSDGAEHRLFQEALDQVELADRLGIDYAWEVEHRESASLMELGGFNVGFDAAEKRRMWQEAVEQCAEMMVMETPTVTARRHRRLPEIGPSHG